MPRKVIPIRTSSWRMASIGKADPGSPRANQKGSGMATCVGRLGSCPKLVWVKPLSRRASILLLTVVFSRGMVYSFRTSMSLLSSVSMGVLPIVIWALCTRAWPRELVQPKRGSTGLPAVAIAVCCAVAISGMVTIRKRRVMRCPFRTRRKKEVPPRTGAESKSSRTIWVVKRLVVLQSLTKGYRVCLKLRRSSWIPFVSGFKRVLTMPYLLIRGTI